MAKAVAQHSPNFMPHDKLIAQLQALIDQEYNDGCCMADQAMVKLAIRRWRSYARRHPRTRDHSLEHRARDLRRGLQRLYPAEYRCELCLRHLSESLAELLNREFTE